MNNSSNINLFIINDMIYLVDFDKNITHEIDIKNISWDKTVLLFKLRYLYFTGTINYNKIKNTLYEVTIMLKGTDLVVYTPEEYGCIELFRLNFNRVVTVNSISKAVLSRLF